MTDHNLLRSKLSSKGISEFKEFVFASQSLSQEIRYHQQDLCLQKLEKMYPPGPIRFIDLEYLAMLGQFPRCPSNMDMTHDLKDIDRSNSLLVFISHCWLRGNPGSEGWDGTPHPDNATGDKYKLCIAGIKGLKEICASKMKRCYVWMDYCCMNQDSTDLTSDLEQYDRIVECCDCLFTPIVDPENKSWSYQEAGGGFGYLAKSFREGPTAYLNRAWCRVEMLYAAKIPVLQNDSDVERHTRFDAGLAVSCLLNRRPHFVFGTKEYTNCVKSPVSLPALQYSFLTEFNPLDGHLSVDSDIKHIRQLLNDLQVYITAEKKPGYYGEINEKGNPNGKGTHIYENGSRYIGQWKDGIHCGEGTFIQFDGGVISGEWNDTHVNGLVKFSDGGKYEGKLIGGVLNGFGRMTLINGDYMEGDYVDGCLNGRGILFSNNSVVYSGEWKQDKKHGYGVHYGVNGAVYEGEWRDGKMHGRGVWRDSDGYGYVGWFCNDQPHGHGCLIRPQGVHAGIFNMGIINS